MTNRRELENLMARMTRWGVEFVVNRDTEGRIDGIQIITRNAWIGRGMPPVFWDPLSAAERMREWLHGIGEYETA